MPGGRLGITAVHFRASSGDPQPRALSARNYFPFKLAPQIR